MEREINVLYSWLESLPSCDKELAAKCLGRREILSPSS